MPETVRHDKDNGVILIDSSDLVGIADLSESLGTVLQISQTHGLNKVMIDARSLLFLPSKVHLFNHVSELSREAGFMKYAIVISEKSHKNVIYLELAANKNNVDMKIFCSQTDALSWLNH